MANKDKENGYTFARFLSDFLSLAILILILDCCGCGICRKIGEIIGEGYNAFNQTTSQVHPNELR